MDNSSLRTSNTPLPLTPSNTTARTQPNTSKNVAVSESLVGSEWMSNKLSRIESLKNKLAAEEAANLTFSPKISKFDRSDRPSDVLESMKQKELKAVARLQGSKKRFEQERDQKEGCTFTPKVNEKSKSLLDKSEYHHDDVQKRMVKKNDESQLKLAAQKYEVSNFDSLTGQKFFHPKINNQQFDNTDVQGGKNNWRVSKGDDLAIGGSGDNVHNSNNNPNNNDTTLSSDSSDSVSALNEILGAHKIHITDALYNDAFDRRTRLSQMDEYVQQSIEKQSTLSRISHRSHEHVEKTLALADRKLERDCQSAFHAICGAKTEYGQEEVLSEEDIRSFLKLCRENCLINSNVVMTDDTSNGDGNDDNDDGGEVSRETVSSIYRAFQKEAGTSKKVTPSVFLKVAKACCGSALSNGISIHDYEEKTEASRHTGREMHPNPKHDVHKYGDQANSHDEHFMYPAHRRASVKNSLNIDTSDLSPNPKETAEPTAISTPTSSAKHPSINYPLVVVNFCRASIRYVGVQKVAEQRKKERDAELQHPFNPKLCQNSLKLDRNTDKASQSNDFNERLKKMELKMKMVDMKVEKKRELVSGKEVEECTFSPKINKYKFRKASGEEEKKKDTADGYEDDNGVYGDGDGDGDQESDEIPKPGHVLIRAVKFNESVSTDELNETKNTTESRRSSIRGWDGPVEVLDYLSKPAHMRLYDRRQHPSRKEARKGDFLEDKEIAECTFKPKINTPLQGRKVRRNTWFGYKESESPKEGWGTLDDSKAKPSNFPKGYEKAIQLAKANKKRREDANAWAENAGYTEESYTKSRLASKGVKPFSFVDSRKKVMKKKREPKLFIDVKLAGGKKGRIGICEGDDPKKVAKGFALTYSLNREMEGKLVLLIEQSMKANKVE